MDNHQIQDIVYWMRDNSNHIYLSNGYTFSEETSAQLWFHLCRAPWFISEYKNPLRMSMEETIVGDGCTYIFETGPCKSMACNVEKAPDKDRCAFHDQIIFSKVLRDYLRDIHDEINTDTRTISRTKGDTKMSIRPNE